MKSSPTHRISPLAQIVASCVLVAFGLLGVTNATHFAAKIVYGVVIAVGLLLVAVGFRRRRSVIAESGRVTLEQQRNL
jgi:hypothetical protein